MDTLRSPGGCAWDAEQTHESLTRYLVEECFEVVEAIETGDAVLLREELGDLLLQVLFHARIAQEADPGTAFGIDEVASDLVAKLVRRHPHVFGPDAGRAHTADQLNETWEAQKVAEKGRTSAVDGVPLAQPALALAAKLWSRGRRAGVLPEAGEHGSDADPDPDPDVAGSIGDRLLALVAEAHEAGVDPEAALRGRARRLRDQIVEAERTRDRADSGE
ncbi:MazG nucleotide pyrophosphohydrolase domain-containing protein [Jatrophihabitans fulvus]